MEYNFMLPMVIFTALTTIKKLMSMVEILKTEQEVSLNRWQH